MLFPAPLLTAGFLGFIFLFHLFQKSRFHGKGLLCLALAPATGLSLCSLILFFSYLISGAQGKFLSTLFVLLLNVFLILRILSSGSFPEKKAPEIPLREALLEKFRKNRLSLFLSVVAFALFLFIFFRFFNLFLSASALNPYGGWDARFFWNVKAGFYFRDPSMWKNMFSPVISWTHPDYPLMLPGAVAWGWNGWGKEVLFWPALVSLGFILSLVSLVLVYLIRSAPGWSAWIAAGFLLNANIYPFWAVSQYADVPLTFFMTAAGVLLVMAFQAQDRALFFASGWMAGMAAWTKNEGLFFIPEILMAGLLAGWRGKKTGSERKKEILSFIQGMALPCLAVLILKLFLGKTGDYAGSSRTLQDYFSLLFGHAENTRVILDSFYGFMRERTHWKGLWFFFFAAVPCSFFLSRNQDRPYSRVFAVLAGLILAGYFVILHLSPHDVRWQISTALYRLLMHSSVLALLFAFETFSPVISRCPDIDSSS